MFTDWTQASGAQAAALQLRHAPVVDAQRPPYLASAARTKVGDGCARGRVKFPVLQQGLAYEGWADCRHPRAGGPAAGL